MFDHTVGEAFRGGFVDADWSRWLRVCELSEVSADRHGLLNNMESGTNFGFSGGRHHVVENHGDGVDRAVDRGVVD